MQTGVCPLCRRSFRPDELKPHIAAERDDIRDYTIKFIQRRHPEWSAADGACSRCWSVYKGLARVMNIFKRA